MDEIEEYPSLEDGCADVVRVSNASFSWGKSAPKEEESGVHRRSLEGFKYVLPGKDLSIG